MYASITTVNNLSILTLYIYIYYAFLPIHNVHRDYIEDLNIFTIKLRWKMSYLCEVIITLTT